MSPRGFMWMPEWVRHCLIAVDYGRVNLDDLVDCKSGGIVRCDGNPSECIMVVLPPVESYEFIAGMVSEDA